MAATSDMSRAIRTNLDRCMNPPQTMRLDAAAGSPSLASRRGDAGPFHTVGVAKPL
jgi:hypothetical protein